MTALLHNPSLNHTGNSWLFLVHNLLGNGSIRRHHTCTSMCTITQLLMCRSNTSRLYHISSFWWGFLSSFYLLSNSVTITVYYNYNIDSLNELMISYCEWQAVDLTPSSGNGSGLRTQSPLCWWLLRMCSMQDKWKWISVSALLILLMLFYKQYVVWCSDD